MPLRIIKELTCVNNREVSTKKERKPITLHHVRESHVVEIDNITRVQVTPLSLTT